MDIDISSINQGKELYSRQSAEKLKNLTISAANSKEEKELMEACKEFEAYFVSLMMKEMRKTIDYSDGIIKRSHGEQLFTEMLDEETGKSIASGSNGLGLAQTLFNQMKNSVSGISYDQYIQQKQATDTASDTVPE